MPALSTAACVVSQLCVSHQVVPRCGTAASTHLGRTRGTPSHNTDTLSSHNHDTTVTLCWMCSGCGCDDCMMVPVHCTPPCCSGDGGNMQHVWAGGCCCAGDGCRVQGGTDTFLQGFCQSLAHLPPRNTTVHCHSRYQYHCHLLADI